MTNEKAVLMIAVMAVFTFATRVIPFLFFTGKRELKGFLKKLADILPLSMIAILVIYCFKSTVDQDVTKNLVTFVSALIVVALHLFKRNTLLSIGAGTVIYMVGLHLFCM